MLVDEKIEKFPLMSLRLLKVTPVERMPDSTNEEANGLLIAAAVSSLTKLKAKQDEVYPNKKNAETGTLDEIPKVSALNVIASAEEVETVSLLSIRS